jgi:hypothetical protein
VASIWEILGSNLGLVIAYLLWGFSLSSYGIEPRSHYSRSLPKFLAIHPISRNIFSRTRQHDYRRGVWIGNRIYWTLSTRNYNSARHYRQFTYSTVHYSTHWVFSICFLSSPLVTVSNGGYFPWFPYCPSASDIATFDSQWTQLELDSNGHLQ